MINEELLKAIMELPKTETDNPISTMNSINIDDLMSAVDRLNKVPDYNDLLKENQELKKKYENAVADYESVMFEKEQLKKQLEPNYYVKGLEGALKEYHQEMNKVTIQQKEFIKWLEDEIKNTQIKWGDKLTENGYIDIAMTVRAYRIILQKYKEIIGEKQ